MSDHHTDDRGTEAATDGGTEATRGGGREATADDSMTDVEREQEIDYLDVEINLLRPATPFMRDHLKVIWTGAIIWTFTTFGPITLTRLAPDVMTSTMPVIEFPLHYFLIAVGGPSAALLLSVWYARKRDQIDRKYGIEQSLTGETTAADAAEEDVAATDGGVRDPDAAAGETDGGVGE